MKMKNISTCIFLLLILPLAGKGQQAFNQQKRIKGPRLGVDVSGVVWQYMQPDQLSLAGWADYEIMPALYAIAEGGRLKVNRAQDRFTYQSTGYYGKIGADYNFLQQKLEALAQYDMIYGGLRFGGARFSHQAQNITLQNEYWGNYQIDPLPEYSMQAFWTELVAGIRVEVLKNLFLGWSVRGQVMLSKKKDPRMDTWKIPGFGNPRNGTSLSFTYSISYRIPLIKVPAGKSLFDQE